MRGHAASGAQRRPARASRDSQGPAGGPGPEPPGRPVCPADQTAGIMWQCTCCVALFHTFKNAKAHLRHNSKCLRRVTESAERKRKDTGRFISIDSLGIIEVRFNTRSNFVGGTGVVSREGRELLNEFQVLLRWI